MALADAPQGSLFSLIEHIEIKSRNEEELNELNEEELAAVDVLPQAVTSYSGKGRALINRIKQEDTQSERNKSEHAESDFAIWTRLQSLRSELEVAEAEDVENPLTRKPDIEEQFRLTNEAFARYKKENKLEQKAEPSCSAEAPVEKKDKACVTSAKSNMLMNVQETFAEDTVHALKAIIKEQVKELVASKKKIDWLLDDQETYDREIEKLELDNQKLEHRNKSLLLMVEEMKRERDDAKMAVEWRRNRLLGN